MHYNRIMGRRKRYIDENGRLQCSECEQWFHISHYAVADDTVLYYSEEVDGATHWYGRPSSYCRTCASKKTKAYKKRRQWLMHDTFNLSDADIEGLVVTDVPNGVRGSAGHRAATQSP